MRIYWKANRDLTFCADAMDVAGQWNCADMNDDIEYPATENPIIIADNLMKRGLIYPGDGHIAIPPMKMEQYRTS